MISYLTRLQLKVTEDRQEPIFIDAIDFPTTCYQNKLRTENEDVSNVFLDFIGK